MFFGTQKKTVDSILLAFSETINDLEQVEAAQLQEVETQQQAITYAEAAKKNASEEAARAQAVRTKLLNLISA